MAAIGTCWAIGSWADDVWADGTWADRVAITSIAAVVLIPFSDRTTCVPFVDRAVYVPRREGE